MTDLHLRAVVGDRDVDIEFAIGAGEVLAVLGPNGAGKTTALHVIAGPGATRQRRSATRRSCAHRHVGRRVRAHPRPPGRPAAAGGAAVSTPECGGQCGVRAAQRASQAAPPSGTRDRRTLAGPGRCRRPCAIGCRGSCPGARPSVWPWRGHWPQSQTCCYSTNHSPASTSPPPPRCESCCVTR